MVPQKSENLQLGKKMTVARSIDSCDAIFEHGVDTGSPLVKKPTQTNRQVTPDQPKAPKLEILPVPAAIATKSGKQISARGSSHHIHSHSNSFIDLSKPLA